MENCVEAFVPNAVLADLSVRISRTASMSRQSLPNAIDGMNVDDIPAATPTIKASQSQNIALNPSPGRQHHAAATTMAVSALMYGHAGTTRHETPCEACELWNSRISGNPGGLEAAPFLIQHGGLERRASRRQSYRPLSGTPRTRSVDRSLVAMRSRAALPGGIHHNSQFSLMSFSKNSSRTSCQPGVR